LAEGIIEGWLTDPYDYERPRRGQVREGVILRVGENGVIIDVGLKRDGIVPRRDIERLGETASAQLKAGQEVVAYILKPEDREGNLILSLFQARLAQDWKRAQEMLDSDEVFQGKVNGYNKGGLTVQFGRLRGFVPGSHLWAQQRRQVPPGDREEMFSEYIGQELDLKVIEVKQTERRLILSERRARRQVRQQRLEQLLDELQEGQVTEGTVRSLADFGAFVDLGGADGLIHNSELAWRRVRHARDVLKVGDDIQVFVLRLDRARKRIGLSLKRLQPDPWSYIELTYSEDQLISGVVTGVADFGAFVALEAGIEGLIHASELDTPPPADPRAVVQKGDELVVRILDIDAHRHRIGLSLKSVSMEEREEWLRGNGGSESEGDATSDDAVPTLDDQGAHESRDASEPVMQEGGPVDFAHEFVPESVL
jgi:small subunit ribosomal protein S1